MTLGQFFETSQCFYLGLDLLLVLLSEALNVHPARLELSTHTGIVGLRLAASDVWGAACCVVSARLASARSGCRCVQTACGAVFVLCCGGWLDHGLIQSPAESLY